MPTAVPGKLSVGGEMTSEVPTPVRFSTWGLAPSLSVMVTLPYFVPVAVGVNVAVMVHCEPADKLPPQLLDWV